MSANVESIIEQLKDLVSRPIDLATSIPKVQQAIWGVDAKTEHDPRLEVLWDLAYDLEYYQPSKRVRSQDPSLYGEEQAMIEIRETLAKLEARGGS